MSEDDVDRRPSNLEPTPADVFALVGHAIRAEIIWILGHVSDFELSFGEVRSRLDKDVEPSQLHYHLQQLVGHFVEETDNGYRLRAAGIRLCLALRTGTFDHDQEQLSIETGIACHVCQDPVEALFDQTGAVILACATCKHRHGGDFLEIPLAAFETGAGDFSFAHFRTYISVKSLLLARSVCPSCANPLTPTFHTGEKHPHKVCIHHSCDLCGLMWTLSIGRSLLSDPELIVFCHEHDVDILSTPFWELGFAATDKDVTIRSTNPWEVALEVTFDGDTLELVVDENLNVVERNRWGETDEESVSLVSDLRNDTGFMAESQEGDVVTLPDDEECLKRIRGHRWSDGVRCPRCGGGETTKEGRTNKGGKRYRCHDCDSTFNDLTATVFAHHRLSLPEMFHILREMDRTETGQIARQLDRSSQSVREFIREVESVPRE